MGTTTVAISLRVPLRLIPSLGLWPQRLYSTYPGSSEAAPPCPSSNKILGGFRHEPIPDLRQTLPLIPPSSSIGLLAFRNSRRYYALQRFQKWVRIMSRCLPLLLRSSGEIRKSASAGLSISGRALSLRPAMRWEGVRGSSWSLEEAYEMRRQFKIIAASVTTVSSSS